MTLKTARRLQKQITADAPACRVTGLLDYGDNSYSLAVLDTKTGVQFTVHSPEAWTERMDEQLDWSEYA